MKLNLDALREWFAQNQDIVIRRGSMMMGMIMLVVALCYAVSIAFELGWL